MRRDLRLLVVTLALAVQAPSARSDDIPAVEWRVIDIDARLDAAGRFHLIETHHIRLTDAGVWSPFREFGLSVDQSIAMKAVTRIDAAGAEHPLSEAEVTGPDQYRYYHLGHLYLRSPEFRAGEEVTYRFEYELLGALSPAWGIGAGPKELTEESPWVAPWTRAGQIVADWREAWPDPEHRLYRLDHDVLYPSRDGPGYVVRRIHYRLEFDPVWKEVHPEVDLAKITYDVDYRVRHLVRYMGEGRPSGADWTASLKRIGVLVAVPAAALLMWLMAIAVEAVRMRLSGSVDSAFIAEHLLSLSPEMVGPLLDRHGQAPAPTADSVLSRLAAERKISIEVEPRREPSSAGNRAGRNGGEDAVEDREDASDEAEVALRLTLNVPLSALPRFERSFLEGAFGSGKHATGDRLREGWNEKGLTLDGALRTLVAEQTPVAQVRSWSQIALFFAMAWGAWLQIQPLNRNDPVPFLVMADFVVLALAEAWPRSWWHGLRPHLPLLSPFAFMFVATIAAQLITNRPFPATSWIGSAVIAIAGYAIVLLGVAVPSTGPLAQIRRLARIRGHVAAELTRAQPQLDDRWMPHLLALGLGGAIAKWRDRAASGQEASTDLTDLAASSSFSSTRFTARLPPPYTGPAGWRDGL